MAYKKQTWVDDETVGTADRFNHMEAGIEEAGKTGGVSTGAVIGWTGAEVPEGYEEVDSSLLPSNSGVEVGAVIGYTGEGILEGYDEVKTGYSTEEILTGRTWTDGKPTYIKVFDLGLIGSASATTTYTVGTNIETLIDFNAKMIGATASEMLPTNKGGGITADINIFSKDNVININLTRSGIGYFSDRNLVVTAEYTKTTDTGNFKYIEKKSVAPIDPITGSIVDTTNIDNKAKNTYSANIIDGLNNELLSKVLTGKEDSGFTDLNDIKKPGVYFVWSNYTNYPSGASTYGGILVVFTPQLTAKNVFVQLFFDGKGDFVVSRTHWYDTVGWSAWKTL